MARLLSEDRAYLSYISLAPAEVAASGSTSSLAGGTAQGDTGAEQLWQLVKIEMGSGLRSLTFVTEAGDVEDARVERVTPEQLQDAYENQTKIANAYMLCRRPTDEIKQLVASLTEICDGKRTKLRFEPAEPCFDLSITNIAGGLRVDFFVDAGNVETGIYRFDALGVRFFTDQAALETFVGELKAEFDC